MKMKEQIFKLFYTLTFMLIITLNNVYGENYYSKLRKYKWVLPEYYEVLQKGNKEQLLEVLPKVEELYYFLSENNTETLIMKWDSPAYSSEVFKISFDTNKDYISLKYNKDTKYLAMGDIHNFMFEVLEENLYFNKKNVLSYKTKAYQVTDEVIIDLPEILRGKEYDIKFEIDGDYLDLYIDGKYIRTFCRMTKETLEEYSHLIENNAYNKSRITWPHYGDGSAKFEDKIIIPEPILTESDVKQLEIENAKIRGTELEVQGKIKHTPEEEENKKVKEELFYKDVSKLKKGVINRNFAIYMNPGRTSIGFFNAEVEVKIIDIGPEDTIDNIKSNWIFVKITSNSQTVSGIKFKGKECWVFGGYLE